MRDIFKFIMSQLLLTRTSFQYTFFLARVFGNFITRCLPPSRFNLFALNLEFEPNTRRELILTELPKKNITP